MRAWRRETPSSMRRTWASGLRPTMDSSPLILKLRPTVPGVPAAVTTSQAVTGCGWVVGMGWRVVVESSLKRPRRASLDWKRDARARLGSRAAPLACGPDAAMEKVEHSVVHFLRSLQKRGVAPTSDQEQLCRRDLQGHSAGEPGGGEAIAIARHHQRRHVHRREVVLGA